MAKYIIAVDAMGGDNAPGAACEGAILALSELKDTEVLLYGQEAALRPFFARGLPDRLSIVHAPDVIDMHESPMLAVRRKPQSSMVMALLAVKNQEAQAFVSAGSTGAILAGGMTRLGRIRGIDRPALAPVLPGMNHPFLLIDCGANVDCQPEYLRQFGLMGSVYMEKVMGVSQPRVGLVNIGSEDEKGNQLAKSANQLMRDQKVYHFVGNVEARDIPSGDVDVVVADGFDGNIILKYTEGLSSTLVSMLKAEMLSSMRAKIGAVLLKPALKRFKQRMSAEDYGGAPLLGVQGAIVKAHGSSHALALKNAIRQARDMAAGDVVGRIQNGVEQLTPSDQ